MEAQPHAHAHIRDIDVSEAESMAGVMHTTAGQGSPEPSPYDAALFDSKVRFVGDRVAAVAAESRAIAPSWCQHMSQRDPSAPKASLRSVSTAPCRRSPTRSTTPQAIDCAKPPSRRNGSSRRFRVEAVDSALLASPPRPLLHAPEASKTEVSQGTWCK